MVLTTIYTFMPEEGRRDAGSERAPNIVVVASDPPRSHCGFGGSLNEKTGEMSCALASNLAEALPNASFIGFTGTLMETTDPTTWAVFRDYISIYTPSSHRSERVGIGNPP